MNVLVTDHFTPASLALLKSRITNATLIESSNPTTEQWAAAEVLLTRTKTSVSQTLLKSAPKLKLVVTATSGFDHVDTQACKESGVKAYYCPEANAITAAEHTLFLILSLLKRQNQTQELMKNLKWKDQLPMTMELADKTVGLVGFGRVGQAVAQRLLPFGCRLVTHDPYVLAEDVRALGVEPLGQTELFKCADLISLHVPLTRKTQRLINRNTIEQMSTGAFLINCSRGGVVNEDDLVLAVREGHLAGAALDVFTVEPLPDTSTLRSCESIFLTPHLGGYTEESRHRASLEAVGKVIDFFAGRSVEAELPLDAAWANDL